MRVNKVLQTPEGPVTFNGELSESEADMIIGLGLNYLLKQGALPFKILDLSTLQQTEGDSSQ